MKRRIFLTFLVSSLLFTSFESTSLRKVDYVYICQGPYSKVYHKSNVCRGLSNCSTKIYKVTLEEAVKMGRRPCKIEYR
jgi:hypothetical protein